MPPQQGLALPSDPLAALVSELIRRVLGIVVMYGLLPLESVPHSYVESLKEERTSFFFLDLRAAEMTHFCLTFSRHKDSH